MATSRVMIEISADDKASAKLKALASGLDQVEDKSKKTTSTWSSLKTVGLSVAAGLAAVTAAAYAAKKAIDFAAEGAKILRLEAAGDSLAASFGQNMDDLINAMQEASNETLSSMDAMSLATRALLLGVAKTPEEFEKLTTAAVALGRAMGRTATESVTDIVTGIGRMSPLILDNLGIMTKGGKIFDEYAASVGKTADQLTDTERKQILLNAALESAAPLLDASGKAAVDAATGYEQLEAASADANAALKKQTTELVAASGVVPVLTDKVGVLTEIVRGNMSLWDAWGLTLGISTDRLRQMEAATLATGPSMDSLVQGFLDGAEEIPTAVGKIAAAMPEIPSIWDKAFPSPADLAQKLQEQIDFIQAGGPGLIAAFENVQSALQAGEITPEQAEGMLAPLSAAAQGLAVELGETDLWSAAKARAEEMRIPFSQAKADIEAGIEAIGTIPQSIDIQINWIMEELPGMQHGGSFVVPGSGRGDRPFVLGLEPGERVDVTPRTQVSNVNNSRTMNLGNVNINNGMDRASVERMFRSILGGE